MEVLLIYILAAIAVFLLIIAGILLFISFCFYDIKEEILKDYPEAFKETNNLD